MSVPRDDFLRRVREAVAEGNRAGGAPPLPQRGQVGYQGAGTDPVARFVQEWTAAGGQAHVVAGHAAAAELVLRLLRERQARRVLLGRGEVIDALGLKPLLRAGGVEEVLDADALDAPSARPAFFGADAGVTGVDHLVAETGTVVLSGRPDQPRSLSLLPPLHVAVAHRDQVVTDLFDLFEGRLPAGLPSGLSLITGPSKTGDIELRLVTGVHGPGEVHVVLIDPPSR
jgi:L-lactate utilization protein LutC